jgi:hypothetical protein
MWQQISNIWKLLLSTKQILEYVKIEFYLLFSHTKEKTCFQIVPVGCADDNTRNKRQTVAGHWRILHNEELYNLCALSNISVVVKSRRMG